MSIENEINELMGVATESVEISTPLEETSSGETPEGNMDSSPPQDESNPLPSKTEDSEDSLSENTPPVESAPELPTQSNSELDLLKEQNKKLLDMVMVLQQQMNNLPAQSPQNQEPQKKEPKTSLTAEDILGADDFDEVMTDKDMFLGVLNRFGGKILNHAYEAIMHNLPQIVSEHSSAQHRMREIANEFYATNADLNAVRPTVQAVMQRIQAEEPNLTLQEVLAKTADVTRQLLGIPKPGVEREVKKIPTPKGSSGKATGEVASNSIADELDAMMKIF